jgi:tetratricopeptide (TPR) repeat protein
LQQSLAARLDRLGAAREIAQIGAVLGRDFAYALLRDVAETDEPALQASLERLADADILFVEGAPPVASYRFKHALIQDAAYDSLLKSRRHALHRRTGEALRDQFAATAAAEPELLAHHFTQAGMTEAAIEWWGTAGQRSLARSALIEGVEQLKRALGQIATLPATADLRREEIKLHVPFANALTLTGDHVGGKEHFDRALAIYDPAEHGPLTTRSGRHVGVTLLSFRSGCVWQLGYPTASLSDAERAVKSTSCTFCGNYTAAHAQLDELIALARDSGSQYWKAAGTVVRGDIFALTGKASDAVQALTSGLTSLRSTGASLYEPRRLWHLAMAHAELGEPDDARRCIDDAIEKVEKSKEEWAEAEVNRIAGEIALTSLAPDGKKQKSILIAHSLARVANKQSPGSRALRRAWRGSGAIRARFSRLANCSRALGGGAVLLSDVASAAALSTTDLQAPSLPSLAPLVDRVKPAVVSIEVNATNDDSNSAQSDQSDGVQSEIQQFLKRFGERDNAPSKPATLEGSGFFISSDGYIVTNKHLVQNAKSVAVTLMDGKSLDAEVVGADARTDIAVLKVHERGDYPFVTFSKQPAKIGDWVVAIGNPSAAGGAVAAGLVSAERGDMRDGPYDRFLQIDAPFNRAMWADRPSTCKAKWLA